MSDSQAGTIIYKAFSPTLKMALCIAVGFAITRRGLFSPQSARGVSVITLNIAQPCLIFSSMVSAFTPQNVGAFGPLMMTAVIYQLLGLLGAWIIREVFWVPIDFRWGILVAGLLSNWGNLPTAIVQEMATEAPFNPDTDVDLGVAYIAIFILVMNMTFFGLGVHKTCGWDFQEDKRVADWLPMGERWRLRIATVKSYVGKLARRRERVDTRSDVAVKMPNAGAPISRLEEGQSPSASELASKSDGKPLTPVLQDSLKCTGPLAPTHSVHSSSLLPTCVVAESAVQPDAARGPPSSPSTKARHLLQIAQRVLASSPPATYAVVIGLPIAVVQPLKALFTETDGWTGTRIPNAPDGNPPLSFVLAAATFLGAINVPGALLLLGASFARLKLPKSWKEVPIGAIVALMTVKMILIPIFGIFVVQAMRGRPALFPNTDIVRTFVAILLSGTPAAANQLVVTQLYNPAGTAQTLATFLLLQYICMFVLSTALAAIALYIVEQ